jgi:hypothetical protein
VIQRNSGFTLAEVVLSLGLFALVALCLTGILTGSLTMQEGGEEDVAAGNLATTILDQWKSRPYSEVAALVSAPLPPEVFLVDGRSFTSDVTVEQLTPAALNPDGEVLVVTVGLTWTELSTQTAEGGRTQRNASLDMASVVSPESAI